MRATHVVNIMLYNASICFKEILIKTSSILDFYIYILGLLMRVSQNR